MPAGQFLSATERERLEGFPNVIEPEDLAAFYTLTDDDLVVMQRRGRDPGSRLAFAVTVCALRHLNFVPARVELAPTDAVRFVAEQLGCRPILDGHAVHERTRRAHALNAIRHGGVRRASASELVTMRTWLATQAMGHASPTTLLELAGQWLRSQRLVRPRMTSLERIVLSSREAADVLVCKQLALTCTDRDHG